MQSNGEGERKGVGERGDRKESQGYKSERERRGAVKRGKRKKVLGCTR